jgi:hypothetical protein
MPAAALDPSPGYVSVSRSNSGIGSREWTVSITGTLDAGAEAAPGAEFTLVYQTSSTGIAPDQATSIQIRCYLPNTTTLVGDVWTIASPATTGQTRTLHMDSNPLNEALGSARAGMIELHMTVIKNTVPTYSFDSRGSGLGGAGDAWRRGFMRSLVTLDANVMSNAGAGGAEPASFAYPDPVYVRTTFDAQFFATDAHSSSLKQAGVSVDSKSATGAGPTFDWFYTAAAEIVDGEYAVGDLDLEVTLDSDSISGNGGAFDEYSFAATGHQAGWVRDTDRALSFAGRTTVDPTVTLVNVIFDQPDSPVYNRGETASGSFEVRNAREESITPVSGDRVRVLRGGATFEDVATSSRAAGVVTWSVTFGPSGNVAPADGVGDEKALGWQDTSAGITLDDPATPTFGSLSSRLNIDIHLQLNNNTLDPALNVSQRLPSQLGFYAVRISNQRGQGKNGVVVEDNLHDDAGLVGQIVRTATTASIEGFVGWLNLVAWDSSLPGGGWDHWVTAGTFEGNSFEKSRSGAGTSDYVLLARNPNNVVICGGGHSTPGEGGLHWTSGSELLIGASMFDVGTQNSIDIDASTELDTEGVAYPRAYMSVTRLNVETGRTEFFDEDKTWKNIEDNQGDVYQWQLVSVRRLNELAGAGSFGDERTYVKIFSEADTVGWGENDLFFVTVLYQNSTPYPVWGLTGVVAKANGHAGYALDTIALGLHGVIGTR